MGYCTKRRPWPNSLKTANVIVPCFCFGRESCSCCFRRISRRFCRGSLFCTFGRVLYKTKTLAKFFENHKYYRSPLLLQARTMFDLFSSDFKTILKGSSFLGLRSSFCTHPLANGTAEATNSSKIVRFDHECFNFFLLIILQILYRHTNHKFLLSHLSQVQ